VQECEAKGEVPISRSSFYTHCVPDNFYYERFEKCCCNACKKGIDALMNLKQLLRVVMECSGTDKDTKRQRMDQLLRLECHCNINMQTQTVNDQHPPPIPAEYTHDIYDRAYRKQIDDMVKNNKKPQLEAKRKARDIPSSNVKKRKLVEQIFNHDVKAAGYHTGCDACFSMYEIMKYITETMSQMDNKKISATAIKLFNLASDPIDDTQGKITHKRTHIHTECHDIMILICTHTYMFVRVCVCQMVRTEL
jgi:hypothetical protein